MNIISFSLWGDNPLYNIGAIKNADLALQIYPNWDCYYYCNKCVPQKTIEELKKRKNVKLIFSNLDNCGNIICMNYRFLAIDVPGAERVIFRDTDSRLSKREKLAVDEWISDDTDIHLMRDHPSHGWFVQGGMFGLKTKKFQNKITDNIINFNLDDVKGNDQTFMSNYLKRRIIHDNVTYTEHDPFYVNKPFPKGSERGINNGGIYFVGQRIEVMNGYDVYQTEMYDAVIKEITDIESK